MTFELSILPREADRNIDQTKKDSVQNKGYLVNQREHSEVFGKQEKTSLRTFLIRFHQNRKFKNDCRNLPNSKKPFDTYYGNVPKHIFTLLFFSANSKTFRYLQRLLGCITQLFSANTNLRNFNVTHVFNPIFDKRRNSAVVLVYVNSSKLKLLKL